MLRPFAITFVLACLSLTGGVRHLRFEQIGEDEELTGTPIRRLFQDRTGFIWIGTGEGLYKFDGYELRHFKHEPLDENSPSNNEILKIIEDLEGGIWIVAGERINRFDPVLLRFDRLEDPKLRIDSQATDLLCDAKGRIWIGTNDKGLFCYDPATLEMRNYRFDPKDPNSLGRDRINALYESKAGELWIGTDGGGLNKYDPLGDRFLRYFTAGQNSGFGISLGFNSISPSRAQSSIVEDSNGDIWFITTGSGLIRFNPRDESHVQYLNRPNDPNSLSSNVINNLFRDSRGWFWLITGERLEIFDPKGESFRGVEGFFSTPELARSIQFRYDAPFVEDPLGRVWIGTLDMGLLMFDPFENQFTQYKNQPGEKHSLSGNQVRALLLDRSNGLWIGTMQGGLNQYSPHKQKFSGFYAGAGENSLPNDGIRTFLRARDGRLWLGTYGGSLLGFDTARAVVTERHLPLPGQAGRLQGGGILDMVEDPDGSIWVGCKDGLFRFSPKSGRFDYQALLFGESLAVFELERDAQGRIWAGTKGDSIFWKEPGQSHFAEYRFDAPTGNRWYTSIRSIVPNGRGGAWVGHYDYGLHLWTPGDEPVSYLPDGKAEGALSHPDISDLCLDRNGNLWVATLGGGINLLRAGSSKFEYFTEKSHALPNNLVYNLIESEDGKLWVSMKSALGVLDLSTNLWRFYDAGDGLVANNSSHNGFYKDEQQLFYYGGLEGFNFFSPRALSHNPNPPRMAFTLFSKMGQPTFGALKQDQLIELAHTDNYFVFEFSALDFTYPAKNQYMYKLDGFDKDWIFSGAKNSANYTNIKGGDYVFRVKGLNSDGVLSLEEARVQLRVIPPFYGTRWFLVLTVLLTVGGAIYAYYEQRRNLRAQQQSALMELDLRRKTEELDSARMLQFSMLPDANLVVDGFKAVGKMRTATEVGGDYYDFLTLPDGRRCLVLGDATGHGFAAGLVVGMTKMTAAIWAAHPQIGLVEIMNRLNIGLKRSLRGKRMGMGLGLTLFDAASGACELAFSGMPFPLHYHADTGQLEALEMRGLPLGFVERIKIQTLQAQLLPGDYLILLSDGVSERFNPQRKLWQNEGMHEELVRICGENRDAEDLAQTIFEVCDRFADGHPLEDDMTVVVLRKS